MIPATREFVRQRFQDYYETHQVEIPVQIQQREFGFLYPTTTGKPFKRRHAAFACEEDLRRHLIDRVPLHAYYAVPYYTDPGNPLMKEKGWTGADLIFDLDGDYLPAEMPFEEKLWHVKEEARQLLALLFDTFAVPKRDIKIVFSGGRGYHIHVFSEKYRQWTQKERREICDYVVAQGIHIDAPVTYDTARLIRLPGSIHGGTGFKVMSIPLENFDRFNGSVDAIAMSDREVKTTIGTLPEHTALFEILGKRAEIA